MRTTLRRAGIAAVAVAGATLFGGVILHEGVRAFVIGLAPLLSAMAALTIAGTAALALKFVHLRAYRKSIDDRFDQIFTFFWDNEKVARGRDLISYDKEYETVKKALRQMTKAPRSPATYSKRIRDNVEAINCLCACISRADLLGSMTLSQQQRDMREAIFGYWEREIAYREELREYFQAYWVKPKPLETSVESASESDPPATALLGVAD